VRCGKLSRQFNDYSGAKRRAAHHSLDASVGFGPLDVRPPAATFRDNAPVVIPRDVTSGDRPATTTPFHVASRLVVPQPPQSARLSLAVVLNVAHEGWSDGKAPGIGPMGNPLPAGGFDSNALSWGSYGATRGIERLLRVLDRTKRSASVMVSGVFGERTPAIVRAIVQAGHELVAHSYAQDVIPAQLTPEAVRADVERTTAALEAASAERPRGWISPRGTPSPESARLLLEANYAWQGDVLDDDRPYLQIFEGHPPGADRIVAIPLTMEINDLPHAMRFGRSPVQYVELFDAALARMRKDEGEACFRQCPTSGLLLRYTVRPDDRVRALGLACVLWCWLGQPCATCLCSSSWRWSSPRGAQGQCPRSLCLCPVCWGGVRACNLARSLAHRNRIAPNSGFLGPAQDGRPQPCCRRWPGSGKRGRSFLNSLRAPKIRFV
jgi:Polysaccharide deacetylase